MSTTIAAPSINLASFVFIFPKSVNIWTVIAILVAVSAVATSIDSDASKPNSVSTTNPIEDGQFIEPDSVAIDRTNGYVFVLDHGNNRVQKFDGNGSFITKWGSPGTGDGQLSSPEGIAVDSEGNVYVADTGNDRVQKFDGNGSFITKWGSRGSGDGQFLGPASIAVDSSGNRVYVADSGNSRIQVFGINLVIE